LTGLSLTVALSAGLRLTPSLAATPLLADADLRLSLYDGHDNGPAGVPMRTRWLTGSSRCLHYKQARPTERAFRTLKSPLDPRPIFHGTDARIRGHVTVSVLALVLEYTLQRLLWEAGVAASTRTALADLERIQAVPLTVNAHAYLCRTPLVGAAARPSGRRGDGAADYRASVVPRRSEIRIRAPFLARSCQTQARRQIVRRLSR
jgi:hypothetical protein